MSSWIVLPIITLYGLLLMAIAAYGDRRSAYRGGPPKAQPFVYALSLAVYCTSWTLFGSVGRASQSGWDFLQIYIGPLIVLLFFWDTVRKLVRTSKAQNITSIADFIGARYGKSQSLAALVTLITIIGIMPYIALQMKAIITGYETLVTYPVAPLAADVGWHLDEGLWLAMVMVGFCVMFGARSVDAAEHHEGMILAVAFESIVKLLSFIGVGVLVTWGIFDGFGDLAKVVQNPSYSAPVSTSSGWLGWSTVTVLSLAAFVILPRQFHVVVVENNDESELKRAQWVMPIYLVAINIFVVPVAIAGLVTLGNTVEPDMYVLTVPLAAGYPSLALFAFIGGVSAATGMIVVATVAMATMVSNDMVMPVLLRLPRLRLAERADITRLILLIRRASIVGILLLSWLYYRVATGGYDLSSIGLVSFAAAIQFAPSVIGGLYWRRGTRWGVIAGLVGGFSVWLDALLLPSLGVDQGFLTNQFPSGVDEVLVFAGTDPFSQGVLWSLLLNVSLFVAVSLVTPLRAMERFQAEAFVDPLVERRSRARPNQIATVSVAEIRNLLDRFLGMRRSEQLFKAYQMKTHVELLPMQRANMDLLDFAEKSLSGVIGTSSARIVVASIVGGANLHKDEVASILSDASAAIRRNRDLLQTTMDTVRQGILVFDSQNRLVFWNQTYTDMFDLEDTDIYAGMTLEILLKALGNRGFYGEGDAVDALIERDFKLLSRSGALSMERQRSDGAVLEIFANPMPEGGTVVTVNDITARAETARILAQSKEMLELRVEERTRALMDLNVQLDAARQQAEAANIGKTRFLAAAGHDLLQPLNAARLFASALEQQLEDRDDSGALIRRLTMSLSSVEDVLGTLLDISKLDAGGMQTDVMDFDVTSILDALALEFEPLAQQKGVQLQVIKTELWITSDRKLLRRILQNYIANAIRYTESGRVVIGCRRKGKQVRIDVFDTGYGIPEDQISTIFQEFTRLSSKGTPQTEEKGLGLGLAIVDRLAQLLNHSVDVQSVVGRGSRFSITVPKANPQDTRPDFDIPQDRSKMQFKDQPVLVIDNEPDVLEGMRALLSGWGFRVHTATSPAQALSIFAALPPVLIVADYHLDDGVTGLDVVSDIFSIHGAVPVVIATADYTDDLRDRVMQSGYYLVRKPIKPAGLRALLGRLLG